MVRDLDARPGPRRPRAAVLPEQHRRPARDELAPELERPRSDGLFVAEYTPLPIDAPRGVTVTARTDTVRTSAELLLEPRVVRMSLGPWVGGTTNFGVATGPMFGLDLDVRTRTRTFGEAMMLRLGVATTSFRTRTRIDPLVFDERRNTMVPVWAALLFRQDRGPFALWGGPGLEVAVHHQQSTISTPGNFWLAGPSLLGGIGRRALGGELILGVRASWLPASQAVGYDRNLGGLSGGLGYRVVY